MAEENVRIEESLKVKIGEAKNLPSNSLSGTGKSTFCVIRLDHEEIYRTSTVEKSLNPFYGEEFTGEIPKKFRYLSVQLYEASQNKSKVIGKTTLRRQELYKYHGKEHWFPLVPVDANNEVQGKVHLEIKFDEYLNGESENYTSQGLSVRVLECSDLPVTNGGCNPYAMVTLTYSKSRNKADIRRTTVKKKTTCPQFNECFQFVLGSKGQNSDRQTYYIEDEFNIDLGVSIWHDDSRMSREVFGKIFPGSFLGEVKMPLKDLTSGTVHNAWYCLRRRESWKPHQYDLGSLRLKISYTSDHVFPPEYYDELRELLLQSPDIEPITSSAAYILSEVVDHRQDAAQPLMKIFLHHNRLVPFIRSLAKYEIDRTADPHTLFRGNTLVTKLIDELMKLTGLPYLQETIKATIDQICIEHKSCEIDPTRLKEGEILEENMDSLKSYVQSIFQGIISSSLLCPTNMCEVFYALKDIAHHYFKDSSEVRYQAVSGFVFLRFFAPAILGPKLFDLRNDTQDSIVNRTLTLISKAIQGLGNLVSSKTLSYGLKEDYMVPLFQYLSQPSHIEAVRMYLDIISSAARARTQNVSGEAPIILKEGTLIKRAQGRKRILKVKNFKRRHFCLTNQKLSYSKNRGDNPLYEIPIEDILAVETLQEESFKMKYMFQVIQPERALYIQANNCVEEKEWLAILTKVCNRNKNRLKTFHPACLCKKIESSCEGCTPVSGGLHATDIQVSIDSDREVEKIHSQFLANREKLEVMQDACADQEVYTGEDNYQHPYIEDTKTCFVTLNEVLKCVISLEQEHMQYRKNKQRNTVIGSIDAPFGDESVVSYQENSRRNSKNQEEKVIYRFVDCLQML
ncbi:RASA3 [Mytilus coruscus]|uniref:RASA3 n=1 Tax=Mytilus coruscus TaxID=42192 RepID=A0A6J8CEN0_MYTCO|nr:RASA3 [Mytilus coruscus]